MGISASNKIYEADWLYTFLRPYVDWFFRRSFRRYRLIGKENLPSDGVYIYAPNHTHGLIDALAVLGIDRQPKVFAARADIFRKRGQAKVLRWLKILPISRVRDGLKAVRNNTGTFVEAVSTLQAGVPFCILPEGTHRPKHSLLPLSKGIFHIALQAYRAFGQDKPVYIVPVGIEYGDYEHLWDAILIRIGSPMPIVPSSELTEPQQLLAWQEELTRRMRELILYVPDDEHYEQAWAKLKANKPLPWRDMDKPRLSNPLRISLLTITLPLFVGCALLCAPMGILILYLRHKIQDPAFKDSVQYVVQLLLCSAALLLPLPLWQFIQEYIYQCRHIKTAIR